MKRGHFIFRRNRPSGLLKATGLKTCFYSFILLLLMTGSAHAALTKQLSYQGRLQDASGQPVANGTYSIVFSIYNVASGGSALWTETQNVNVESGGFSAYLGSVTALTLPFNEDYYLGIKVGSDPEMTPRMKLAVVGTAAFSLEAGMLQGKAASDFALSTHNHDSNYSASAHTHTLTVGTAEITDGSIGAVDIDATAVQKRVSGTCAGQVLVAINQDGTVTCEADDTGSGGGTPLTPAASVTSVGASNIVGTSTSYAREDHQHNIPAGLITDAMISNSAGIAYSKLSLLNSVTNADISSTANIAASKISGLGSLAALNAVSGTEIQDATITFADIASNSCLSGQIVEYNGSAWVCGTDDTTGGGAVVNNPGATQTIIAGNSSTTPLALKAASAPTAAMFDVQDFAGGSVVKVAPSGNLLVGNPAQIAPKLSVEDTSINPGIAVQQKGTGAALDVWQSGTSGSAGVFSITNAGNTSDLISGDLSGTGSLLKLSLSGINKFVVSKAGDVTATSFTGSGIGLTGVSASDPNAVKINPSALQTIQPTADIVPLVIKDDAAATADLLDIQNNASTSLMKVNSTGNLLVGSPTVTNAKVSAEETGTANKAGAFEIMNVSNANSALLANTTGTGNAGEFGISNGSNASAVLVGDTSGTGNLLQLQKSGVDKFVVDNAGNITVGGAANAVKTNPSAAQTIAPTADATALVLKPGTGAPTLDIFGINNFSDVNLLKVSPTGNLLVGNPSVTTAKVSAEEAGTANGAGYFEISNASNSLAAVYGGTVGMGKAGDFSIVNATNTSPAVYGATSGTGKAGDFSIVNATNTSPAVYATTTGTGALFKGNSTGAGNLFQLQQSGVDKFLVDNLADINIFKAGTSVINVSDAGSTILNITNAGVGTASLQVEGATVLTSANGVITNPSAAQTIQPTADVVPLAIKDDAGSVANLLEVKNNAGANLLYVNPAGRLMVGAPTTIALVSSENQNTGVIEAGRFIINNSTNSANALTVEVTQGTGQAGQFTIADVSNSNPVLVANTTGTGDLLNLRQLGSNKLVVNNTGNLLVGNPVTTTAKVSAYESGTSNFAGYFEINNAGNNNLAVYGLTNGIGSAGAFEINNASSSFNAVEGYTNGTGSVFWGSSTGTGNLLQLQKSGVDKFVVNNAGSIETTGYINAGTLYVGALGYPTSTTAEMVQTGTGNAGYFLIDNAGNSASLIQGSIISGTGSLLQLQQSAADQFVVGQNGKITFSTGANKAVGTGTVNASTACATVPNTSVLAGSIVLITVTGTNAGTDIEALKVKTITPGASFDVCTVKESVGHTLGITFSYLIVN